MSESEKKQRRQRRSFGPEFMAGAVKLVLEEGRFVAQVARDLTETAFRKWVEQAKTDWVAAQEERPGDAPLAHARLKLHAEPHEVGLTADTVKT